MPSFVLFVFTNRCSNLKLDHYFISLIFVIHVNSNENHFFVSVAAAEANVTAQTVPGAAMLSRKQRIELNLTNFSINISQASLFRCSFLLKIAERNLSFQAVLTSTEPFPLFRPGRFKYHLFLHVKCRGFFLKILYKDIVFMYCYILFIYPLFLCVMTDK